MRPIDPIVDRLPVLNKMRRQGSQFFIRYPGLSNGVWINHRKLSRGHKANARLGADEVEILPKAGKRSLRFRGSALRRRLPLFPRRVGAASKIDPVPELLVNPFAGMIENAD